MTGLRVSELSVQNVGPFVDTHFVFPEKVNSDKAEIHILTGENGSGKTTLLYILSSIVKNGYILQRFHSDIEGSQFEIKFSNGEILSVDSVNGSLRYKNTPAFISEYNRKSSAASNSVFDIAFFTYSGARTIGHARLNAIQEIAENPLGNALNFAPPNPNLLVQWIANNKTKEALAASRGDLQRAKKYGESIHKIERSISQIVGLDVKFILREEPLAVLITVDGQHLEFDLLPEGLKSIVSWISDLLMRLDRIKWENDTESLERHFILLLDEIDVHLHPAWQRKILPAVQKLFSNAQIFITTHSPFVVGSVDGAWVHRLRNSQNGFISSVNPILSEDAKSYGLILNEIFGISDYFGIEVEQKLSAFRKLRNALMHSDVKLEEAKGELQDLVKFFKNQSSIEIDNIIGMELKQLERVLDIDKLLND